MKLFSASFSSLPDIYVAELAKALDIEETLVKALPRMSQRAQDLQLKQAIQSHLAETQRHVVRVKRLLRDQGSSTSKVIRALVSEAEEIVNKVDDAKTFDIALVSFSLRIAHYEMAVYGTLKAWAQQIGRYDDLQILSIIDAEAKQSAELLQTIGTRLNPGVFATAA